MVFQASVNSVVLSSAKKQTTLLTVTIDGGEYLNLFVIQGHKQFLEQLENWRRRDRRLHFCEDTWKT